MPFNPSGSTRAHGPAAAPSEIEMESLVGRKHQASVLVHLAEPDARAGFVRKVFGIICSQLLVTVVVAGIIVRHGHRWRTTSPQTMTAAMTVSAVVSFAIAWVPACCPAALRTSPGNYGIMFVFTVAESVLVGVACLHFTAGSILMCACLTLIVMLGLTSYAMRTKVDVTSFGPYLLCALLVLVGTGFLLSLAASFGLAHTALFSATQLLYAAGGALIFSVFIVYDTQMILGGNHGHEFSIDDYMLAAMCLYLDIIQLFMSLLQLLGSRDDGI